MTIFMAHLKCGMSSSTALLHTLLETLVQRDSVRRAPLLSPHPQALSQEYMVSLLRNDSSSELWIPYMLKGCIEMSGVITGGAHSGYD